MSKNMITRVYKFVQESGSINAPPETIYEIINREALNEGWEVHTIDFSFSRALLTKEIMKVENNE